MSKTKQIKLAGGVRWMIRRDMPEVLEIEQLCFDDPWPEDEFIAKLRQRNCIGMVYDAVYDPKCPDYDVRAFMMYELHKTKLEILNFAVHPFCQRRGVGRAMINKLVGKLSKERRNRIVANVRESNADAHMFFKVQGFEATDILREFFANEEDAYRFVYRVVTPPAGEKGECRG